MLQNGGRERKNQLAQFQLNWRTILNENRKDELQPKNIVILRLKMTSLIQNLGGITIIIYILDHTFLELQLAKTLRCWLVRRIVLQVFSSAQNRKKFEKHWLMGIS